MNFEEVVQFEVEGVVRAIALSLGKNSNVETFEEGTLCG
jgi:hypothetical protein